MTAVTSAEWGEGLKKRYVAKVAQRLKAGMHNPLGITVIRIDLPRNLAGTGKQYP